MRGLIGVFRELDAAVQAIEELKHEKLGDITVYTPTPRHEFEHVLRPPVSVVRRFTLIGGLCGAVFGYWIAVWTSDYWPLVVGGKAIATWVPYTVFGFELMVLVGGLSTVVGVFVNGRIPRILATVGYDPRFSQGSFGVWVEPGPSDIPRAEQILRESGAVEVRYER